MLSVILRYGRITKGKSIQIYPKKPNHSVVCWRRLLNDTWINLRSLHLTISRNLSPPILYCNTFTSTGSVESRMSNHMCQWQDTEQSQNRNMMNIGALQHMHPLLPILPKVIIVLLQHKRLLSYCICLLAFMICVQVGICGLK